MLKDKIWFIQIGGLHEGPYSAQDLKNDLRINPDTLVWKKGFVKWIPIRDVPELDEVFEEKDTEEQEEEKPIPRNIAKGKDELAIDLQKGFPPIIFLLIILLILSYLIFRFYD